MVALEVVVGVVAEVHQEAVSEEGVVEASDSFLYFPMGFHIKNALSHNFPTDHSTVLLIVHTR